MLSKFKRRVAQLSAVALAATMLALVPASPAMAAVKVPLDNARFSACPANASIPAAGFTDTTSTDVDCIAYYGITTGTTDTTYSPDESVTRWQMALYLTRAAGPAGVTLGAGTDDGTFTDISGKSDEIKTAIMQIKDLGVTVGKTATTFAPDDNVTREEMALFINRFLASSTLGPGGANDLVANDDGLAGTNVGSASTTTNYTDIGTGTTYEGRNAIAELWHMGITDDPSSTSTVYSTTYSPASDMTRAAMATFMTKALGHTNARPKGVTLQSAEWDAEGDGDDAGLSDQGAGTPSLSVSYRADDFTWAAGTAVDVFSWTNSTAVGNTDFLATGLCNTTYTAPATNAVTECYIDAGDVDTDAYGNTTPTVAAYGAGSTTHYWAWTAADGTNYDNDLHASGASKISIATNYDATDFSVSTDIPATALTSREFDAASAEINPHVVKFGTDVTVSFDATWHYSVYLADYATNQSLLPIAVQHERWVTDSGSAAVYSDNTKIIDTTSIIYTDASGDASFTVTSPTELSTTVGDDEVTDKITITSATLDFYDGNVVGNYNNWSVGSTGASTDATGSIHIQWHDDLPAFSGASLVQSSYYGALSTAGVTRTATYTAYDQYGAAWTGGEAVTFSSRATLPSNADSNFSVDADTGLGDEWTTTAAHGLTTSSTVYAAVDAQSCLPSTVDVVSEALAVSIVTTSTTFQVTDADGDVVLTDADCTDATSGVQFKVATFADAARTTGSGGTASVTWSDVMGTSGSDVITAQPTDVTDAHGNQISASTSTYLRTVAATDATVLATGTGNACDNGGQEVNDFCMETANAALSSYVNASQLANTVTSGTEWFDNANNAIVVGISYGDIGADEPVLIYMTYVYDDNDHFIASDAATTMAKFESYLGGFHTNGATTFLPATGAGGFFGADYEPVSTNISQFYTG